MGMKWSPIEDLPARAEQWVSERYLEERDRWHIARTALQSRDVDRTILDSWTEERTRLFAIETGEIENLYTMRRGMTEMLIVEGLENARASHTVEGVLSDETLRGLLRDQHDAVDMVFQGMHQRPLSESLIKEWHALLTRHQEYAPSRNSQGQRVGISFLKGAYKRRPNNPRTADGSIHEYCPPEQTTSEMERLLKMYHEHERVRNVPTPVAAAWLHHRFVQIHPFEDGNGRTARLLMSYVFAKRWEPTVIITARDKPGYFDALEEADRGNLKEFAYMLEVQAEQALRGARRGAEKVLSEARGYHHLNGDLSTKSDKGGWTRHKGHNGRESQMELTPEEETRKRRGEQEGPDFG